VSRYSEATRAMHMPMQKTARLGQYTVRPTEGCNWTKSRFLGIANAFFNFRICWRFLKTGLSRAGWSAAVRSSKANREMQLNQHLIFRSCKRLAKLQNWLTILNFKHVSIEDCSVVSSNSDANRAMQLSRLANTSPNLKHWWPFLNFGLSKMSRLCQGQPSDATERTDNCYEL
jgi:hypothetical protein